MRSLIFGLLFLINSAAANASVDRDSHLAEAGYKDAVTIRKISDGGKPRSALIVLTHNGELRSVEGLYNAIDNRRENESEIAKGIVEIAIVSDRLLALDRAGKVFILEPKAYSLNLFARDLFAKGESAKVFFPWSIALAGLTVACVPEVGAAGYIIGACAQLAVAGRMYTNREKLAKPQEAGLVPVENLKSGSLSVSEYRLVRSSEGKISDIALNLDGDAIRLTELRELEQKCDSILVPRVQFRYELYNP